MDINEIKQNFPVGSQANRLLVNLIENGYFDFRITLKRKKLFPDFLMYDYPINILSDKYLTSNAKVRQLIANTLGAIAYFVLQHQDELQQLYIKSSNSTEVQNQLQNYCYNISKYYRNIYYPAPPEARNPFAPLQFSIKTTNLLKRANINTIAELCSYTPNRLMNVHRMGKISLAEIQTQLTSNGFKLMED
ncbi:MAG: DNA-directed RNA polymerase subunit alpha C-terminal domain-containing protein [Bacteroidia bacterium]